MKRREKWRSRKKRYNVWSYIYICLRMVARCFFKVPCTCPTHISLPLLMKTFLMSSEEAIAALLDCRGDECKSRGHEDNDERRSRIFIGYVGGKKDSGRFLEGWKKVIRRSSILDEVLSND
ncbi:hypothetical protein HNY73_003307 [Argiope bruennichi]|uniref:Uncharacterized protein n=1 Tax=Argiope bruennichi TaxID=94029 RepID=A0A8T0FXI5_ARGBR|nr:hypothetical protein HNY73_003307 [Argiope bruennichi]